MKQGWISVHRQLEDHWLWEDKPYAKGQAWVDLLMLANHEDNKFLLGNELMEVKAGSFVTSISKLCKKWGWSNTKVVKFLDVLEAEKMIKRKSDTKKTVITIENYSVYQESKTKKRRKNDAETMQKHTNNNDNNENNIIYNADPQLNATIKEFIKFRRGMKKPMTDHAIELLINKLNKLSSNTSEQIEILNQSMLNGWQGIFPLKESGKKPKETTIDESKNDLDDLF